MPCVLTLAHENPASPGVTRPADTNTFAVLFSDEYVAVTVAEPRATAVSMPDVDTLATEAGVTLHIAVVVTSCVLPSLNVQIAAS
jgi:hypothetical protein